MKPIIEPKALQELLKSPEAKSLVIFDCRFHLVDKQLGPHQYAQGHLPGAHHLNLETHLSGPCQEHGGRHPLPSAAAFSETLTNLGVTQHSTLVVYDDSNCAYAARAWWLLRYFGHTRVLILNGGFRAWCATGGSLDRRTPNATKGHFIARPQADWIVEREQLLAATKEFTLIDSREHNRYKGLEEPIDPIAGHIPGAVNYFWQEALDTQGRLKSDADQKARWEKLTEEGDLVVYCGSGVTACVNILSLTLSGKSAKLYPGSWSDWCSYAPKDVLTSQKNAPV
jgi:thiosulfate/3-mercaptopyruvate sulfurtransferase